MWPTTATTSINDGGIRSWGIPGSPRLAEIYERMSPFNKVENVKTPTLILCGEKDWNVPVINSEQLYLALKKLGVPTEARGLPGRGDTVASPPRIRKMSGSAIWSGSGKYLQATD